MTYARLHILTSVVGFISGILLPTDLFLLLFSFIYSLSCYSIIFCLQFIMLWLCAQYFYARAPSSFLTHWLGRFLTNLDLHVQIECFISLIRCSMRPYMLRGAGVSLLDHQYSCSLSFLLFLDSLYIIISCHSISLFIYYHVWMLTCDIAMIMIYYNLIFIACYGLLKALRVYVRYFPCVYASPTLVATPFPCILGSEAWHFSSSVKSSFKLRCKISANFTSSYL